jgi:hypothetical protein
MPFSAPTAGAGAAAAQPANVTSAPYGALPSLPAVPEPRVGISARPARTTTTTGAASMRASPLVSLRGTASGAAGAHRLGGGGGPRPSSVSPLGSLGVVVSDGNGTASAGTTPIVGGMGGSSSVGTPGSALRARANPHQLFIREPPPATSAAANGSSVFSPARGGGGGGGGGVPATPVTAARTGGGGGGGSASPLNPFTPLPDLAPNGVYADGRDGDDGGAGTNAAARVQSAGLTRGGDVLRGELGTAHRHMPQLGSLEEEGYWFEPSITQLVAMYSTDPASLGKVREQQGMGRCSFIILRAEPGSSLFASRPHFMPASCCSAPLLRPSLLRMPWAGLL